MTADAVARGGAAQTAGKAIEVDALAAILIVCVAQVASDTYNPFIYFRF